MLDGQILWMVQLREHSNIRFFTAEWDRESAKRAAHRWIGGNKDEYVVSPLTEKGDRVRVELTLSA